MRRIYCRLFHLHHHLLIMSWSDYNNYTKAVTIRQCKKCGFEFMERIDEGIYLHQCATPTPSELARWRGAPLGEAANMVSHRSERR
jgi:hypothetical protein